MNILKSWYKKYNIHILAACAISVVIILFVIVLQSIVSKKPEKRTITQSNVQVPYQKLPTAPTMAIEEAMDMNMQLKTNVQFNEDTIIVTNGESTAWQDCTLELNRGIVNKGYIYTLASLSAQHAITLQLKSFTKDGVSFNPLQTKVQNITLMCNDVAGKSGWNYFSNK